MEWQRKLTGLCHYSRRLIDRGWKECQCTIVTFEWLPAARWNWIKKRGEFSPRPHSCWFCWRVCSARDPCTQRSLGSHSEALRSQLDNKAFVQTCRNSKLSTKNKKCQALTFHRGQGRKTCNLLTPEKNILLMHNPCKLNFLSWKGKIIKRDVMPVLWINVCMLFLFYNC